MLVAAPTGSGKTVVAEYAIATALDGGGKAFYTTPLKALSNQKFGDFSREYGARRVGLLTGDNSINGDAPVVVMTTEVLRNMIYAPSSALEGCASWSSTRCTTCRTRTGARCGKRSSSTSRPTSVVCLSATVSNAEEFAAWVETVRGETAAVIEERRPVRLEHLYMVGERGGDRVHLLPTFVERDGEARPNPEAARLDSGGGRPPGGRASAQPAPNPRRFEIVEVLSERRMLPAITFVFSRAGCDQAVQQCVSDGLRLTSADERAEIRRIAEEHTDALSDEDLEVLRYGEWITGLEAGLAAHHAGMVPPMKEAVEEGFAAGLVKMVFATETLSLGINMPARSVVIEKLSKFTGEQHEFLTPGSTHSSPGGPGRRGIDDVGYAGRVLEPVRALRPGRVAGIPAHMRAALVVPADLQHGREPRAAVPGGRRAPPPEPVVRAVPDRPGRRRARTAAGAQPRAALARHRDTAERGPGDIDDYRRLSTALDDEQRGRRTSGRGAMRSSASSRGTWSSGRAGTVASPCSATSEAAGAHRRCSR